MDENKRVASAFTGRHNLPAAVALCLLLLAACKNEGVSVGAPVDPRGWNYGEEKTVVYMNTDTISLRQLSVFVVRDAGWKVEELDLEVTVVTPDSLAMTETVPIIRKSSESSRRLNTVSQVYRCDVVFNKIGEYRFALGHHVAEPVRGIRAVGIEIKDMKNGKR